MLSKYENMYAGLVAEILKTGEIRPGRNGDTIGLFAKSFSLNTPNEIPLLSGRKLPFKSTLGELAAMFRGPKHVKDFEVMGCNYWDQWADTEGNLNLDYGNAWLDFNGVNQLAELKRSLIEDPFGRRHIISGWRPDKLKDLSLPCCHLLYQWHVTTDNKLNMIWYQRSVDVMLGLPANVILATVWNQLLANELGLISGTVNFMLGDVHIYKEHLSGAHKYMANACRVGEYEHYYKPSKVFIDIKRGMKTEDFLPSMVSVVHYDPVETIKMECLK